MSSNLAFAIGLLLGFGAGWLRWKRLVRNHGAIEIHFTDPKDSEKWTAQDIADELRRTREDVT